MIDEEELKEGVAEMYSEPVILLGLILALVSILSAVIISIILN